jgi:hypothetical protein
VLAIKCKQHQQNDTCRNVQIVPRRTLETKRKNWIKNNADGNISKNEPSPNEIEIKAQSPTTGQKDNPTRENIKIIRMFFSGAKRKSSRETASYNESCPCWSWHKLSKFLLIIIRTIIGAIRWFWRVVDNIFCRFTFFVLGNIERKKRIV